MRIVTELKATIEGVLSSVSCNNVEQTFVSRLLLMCDTINLSFKQLTVTPGEVSCTPGQGRLLCYYHSVFHCHYEMKRYQTEHAASFAKTEFFQMRAAWGSDHAFPLVLGCSAVPSQNSLLLLTSFFIILVVGSSAPWMYARLVLVLA